MRGRAGRTGGRSGGQGDGGREEGRRERGDVWHSHVLFSEALNKCFQIRYVLALSIFDFSENTKMPKGFQHFIEF